MKKERWAIIKPSHVSGIALVLIDSRLPSTIYWNGGPGYMTNAKYEILEEVYTDADTSKYDSVLDKLELSMWRNHCEYEPATEPLQSEGWISLDGKVYYCGYGEHIYTAHILMAKIYNKLSGKKELEDKKWLKMYGSGMIIRGDFKRECTQQQLDAISWLLQAPNPDGEWLEEIKEQIRHYEVK